MGSFGFWPVMNPKRKNKQKKEKPKSRFRRKLRCLNMNMVRNYLNEQMSLLLELKNRTSIKYILCQLPYEGSVINHSYFQEVENRIMVIEKVSLKFNRSDRKNHPEANLQENQFCNKSQLIEGIEQKDR